MESVTRVFRSDKVAAGLLLVAALVGLALANLPTASALDALQHATLGPSAIGLDLSVHQWIADGLLALFFFVVAIDLRHELTRGELSSPSKVAAPALAAMFGVLGPIVVYLAITAGTPYTLGWPVPTATDIAFALGVLAAFGRGIPAQMRAFLLALAVLDDLVGIVFLAVLFAHDTNLVWLVPAVVCVAGFAIATRLPSAVRSETVGAGSARPHSARAARRRASVRLGARILLATVLGLITWWCVFESGVHATIAGVALGLAVSPTSARAVLSSIQPWINGLVLPVFAFSSAAIAIPQVTPGRLSPAFWGIVVGLPVGKLIGITAGGALAAWAFGRNRAGVTGFDLVTVAAIGGIGFTVSLLMGELAFRQQPEVAHEAVLAVLLGSLVASVLSVVLLLVRRRLHQRQDGALADAATTLE